ncbi:MAG: 5-oxoprolinase subunit PxpB [Chthoniobacteraceae bacterium]
MLKITPLGDAALVLHVPEHLGNDSRRTLQIVLECLQKLRSAALPAVTEAVPAYTSIGVFYDPAAAAAAGAPEDGIFDWMSHAVIKACAGVNSKRPAGKSAAVVEIPVCYEGDFAPDLEDVARHAAMTMAEVIQLHTSAEYHVHCLGFSPGFPYLGGLPSALATPRRAHPRTRVPAGAVGIGGKQTGIYPSASPGGWNLIGRSPVRLFDPSSEPPALLRAGDIVRFVPITRAEFDSVES